MNQLAVVGCGNWGKNLLRNFHRLGVLSHICDSNVGRLMLLAEQYPDVVTTTDYEAVLTNDHIKAVIISTPAEQHAWMAEAALLAGKDVFVEKPLALRYRDGEKLVRLAEQFNRILMVGHLLEYHPAILKLKQIIDRGELGKVQYIYSNRLNLGRVRREENILWSFAPHDIAVILRLIGELPMEVTSTGGAYLQPNIADVTVTNMLFDNGVRAHIFVSWLHPYKEHRLVVVGAKKMACFNDVAAENKLLLYDQGMDWIDGEFVPRQGGGTSIEFAPDEPLMLECQHFLECLETRRMPRTDGTSALQVLSVLQASHRSLQTQGQPVQMASPLAELVTI
ncbi:MAG: Gfo/Idh/MocA family oxidoreductase [Pyrinomonadaceae bacterium]|nr:Gfo/Idh/MocA family oxidoreductase [Pyrinomonadaceae bacterium]